MAALEVLAVLEVMAVPEAVRDLLGANIRFQAVNPH